MKLKFEIIFRLSLLYIFQLLKKFSYHMKLYQCVIISIEKSLTWQYERGKQTLM